jgi:hypothetical protein
VLANETVTRPILVHHPVERPRSPSNGQRLNRVQPADAAVHDWYRFVLSFPPHLVKQYVDQFDLGANSLLLDPFCGTGTTLVEARKLGIPSVGVEAHPMTHFAAQVKLDWSVDPDGLQSHAYSVAEIADRRLSRQQVPDTPLQIAERRETRPKLRSLPFDQERLLLGHSISPKPLHKALVLRDVINEERDDRYARHELLALAKTVVFSASNLVFGPEVGVEKPKRDASVVAPWLDSVTTMARDLRTVGTLAQVPSAVYRADSRDLSNVLAKGTVSGVITSPPYPNEKDYSRTTRLESVLLGFLTSKEDLRAVKRGLVRSNTRGIYKIDDDDVVVRDNPEIQAIAESIERRRVELGKTSGFERMYPRAAKLYFGGMARHFANLRPVLARGSKLAYVVGDQASYLRVMIRTGQLLADLAEGLGYEVLGIELFRTRLATITKEQLREEVVVLRWP